MIRLTRRSGLLSESKILYGARLLPWTVDSRNLVERVFGWQDFGVRGKFVWEIEVGGHSAILLEIRCARSAPSKLGEGSQHCAPSLLLGNMRTSESKQPPC